MPLPAAPVRTHARSMRTDSTDAPDSSSPADSSTTTAATTSSNDEQRFLHDDQLDTHTVRTLNLTGCMFEDSEISEQQAKLRWKNEKKHDHHITSPRGLEDGAAYDPPCVQATEGVAVTIDSMRRRFTRM